MKLWTLAAAAVMALFAPAAAHAAPILYGFNTSCVNGGSAFQPACTSTNGSYGNSIQLTSAGDTTLKVLISGWQANQTNGNITSAFLGAYSNGLGVTGMNDASGGSNLHTMDNIGGYTDFVMLQFSRAVNLYSLSTNPFALTVGNSQVTDSDASFYNANGVIVPAVWSTKVDITCSACNNPSAWTNISGGSSSATNRLTGAPATQFSTVWLVSASMLTTDRNDGFKLSQIIVTPKVLATPEPATWAMMIIGFGGIGASLRRRARLSAGASVAA